MACRGDYKPFVNHSETTNHKGCEPNIVPVEAAKYIQKPNCVSPHL